MNFTQKCDLAGGQHVLYVTDYFKLKALTLNGMYHSERLKKW